jgi:hypothetical protein
VTIKTAEITQNEQIKATVEGNCVDHPNLMNEKDTVYDLPYTDDNNS